MNIREYITKKTLIIFFSLIVVITSIVVLNNNKKEEPIKEDLLVKVEQEKKELCMVDVKGYVKKPGLYKVECNLRIQDIIDKAGGLEENADTSVINLGKKVFDEMVLVVYSNDEVNDFLNVKERELALDEKCINSSITKNDACIDKKDRVEVNVSISDKEESNFENKTISINTASKEEFMTLPGIGESKALAIINYRNENGLFASIEDIMKVSGIGEKMFEKIKNSITL